MKKPLNKVTLALWIMAGLFVLAEIWTYAVMFRTANSFHAGETYVVMDSVARSVQSTLVGAAMLTAFGMLIELVDQIRSTIARAVEKS